MSAHAVKSPEESPRVINPLVYKSLQYAFPDASNVGSLNANAASQPSEGAPLGALRDGIGPGVKIGDTYYDYQHNGRMTRMVDWGNDVAGGEGFMVHFEWMRLATEVQENRHYAYNVYYAGGGQAGTFLGQTVVQSPGEYAGYVSLDVTDDGRAVLGGHNNQGAGYQAHTYFDFGPGFAFFGTNCRIPDEVVAAGTGQDPQDSLHSAIWPSIRYHETPGKVDPVLHVFTQVSQPGAGDPQAIIYFRKVGLDCDGTWDNPPYVVDTVFDIAQDVACSNTDGKMALTWIANLPDPGDCDTCSSQQCRPFVQWDNDVYYQISYDYGATFSPRVNLTQNVDGEEGFRPYTDMQALMTSDNDLHIIWGSRSWPADANSGGAAGLLRGRVFHWGENLGFVKAAGNIRTVANLEWDQEYCNGGAWQLNGAKMSLGECDGKLYGLWTQFNDPQVMMNDCHNRALAGTDVVGAANGELYIAVSDDMGLTWDAPRNLTNTHTPACDSVTGAGGRCQSEHWSSMNRHGTNLTGDMTGTDVVDPSGGYVGDYFLDVQYIDDPDPGGIVQDEGTWQQADVMWFRLACVEPIPTAIFNPSPPVIAFPSWSKHGVQKDTALTIENSGNTALTYAITVNEYTGPTGWLTHSGLGSGVPSGTNNTVTGTIHINTGGIVNTPGTIVHLSGDLTFTGNSTTSPDVIEIDHWVADTLVPPTFDTLHTGCFALVVSSNGSWGNQGAGHVNLDYFDYGDCDDLEGAEDTIPGDATVYVYDASPVICWPDGDSVICNWSVFGNGYLSDVGFFPLGHVDPIDMGTFEMYQSVLTTRDTNILIEKLWIAPYDQTPPGANFIIQVLKLSSYDGQTHTGLNIGEAIDWDVPADSASRNRSGFYLPERLIYQFGSEYNEDDDVECQENSDRYAGIKLAEIVEISPTDTTESTDFWGAYTEDNPTWVYGNDNGYVPREIDSMMTTNEGYVIESDSLDVDLHTVMTFRSNYTLAPGHKIVIFKCLITTRLGYAAFIAAAEACDAWYEANLKPPPTGCCNEINTPLGRGDVDYAEGGTLDAVDISDLVYMVDFMFTGGDPPPCWDEAELVEPFGDEALSISDLVYLVDYMFTGGPPPPPCP
jgi:hypothetical protein